MERPGQFLREGWQAVTDKETGRTFYWNLNSGDVWQAAIDGSSGNLYYWNPISQEVSWTNPAFSQVFSSAASIVGPRMRTMAPRLPIMQQGYMTASPQRTALENCARLMALNLQVGSCSSPYRHSGMQIPMPLPSSPNHFLQNGYMSAVRQKARLENLVRLMAHNLQVGSFNPPYGHPGMQIPMPLPSSPIQFQQNPITPPAAFQLGGQRLGVPQPQLSSPQTSVYMQGKILIAKQDAQPHVSPRLQHASPRLQGIPTNQAEPAEAQAAQYRAPHPIFQAANKNLKEFAQTLIAEGVDLNIRNKHSSTPLHEAAFKNSKEVAELLLAARANPNLQNKYGSTPLHEAAFKNSKEVVGALLAAGADPNIQNKFGSTPLHDSTYKNFEEVAEMLLAAGSDPDIQNQHGNTPLHEAAHHGFFPICEMLVKYGTNVLLKNKNSETAFMVAKKNAHLGIFNFLVAGEHTEA